MSLNPGVLIPVHNERETIGDVLERLREVNRGDVLVVDDGSTDGTREVLARYPWVHVRTHVSNAGYGGALWEGMRQAFRQGHRHLVVLDGDGQHFPERVPEFVAALEEGWDIVSGSRYLPASVVLSEPPRERRSVNRAVTEEIAARTGFEMTDAFCGYKAYDLAKVMPLDVRERGYAMPMEFWARAWQAGLSMREVAVERVYLDYGRTFGGGLDDAEERLRHYLGVWRRALELRATA